jgi:hypothetical protein
MQSTNRKYGFQPAAAPENPGRTRPLQPKKSRRFRRLLKVDNREASNRVDRNHSVSDQGRFGYNAEALIDRK